MIRRIIFHHQNALYLTVLIVLSVGLWLPRLRGPLDFRYDAGVYYTLGTSLAEGKGYRLLNEPGEIQAIQYPPLLPLFAAAYQRLAGSNHPAIAGHWLRLSFFLLSLGFIVASYRLSRHYLAPGLAFLATLVVLLHVHTTWLAEVFFAELPFGLAGVLFLLLMTKEFDRSKEWLAGALGAICFLLRSSGIALLGAWVGESLFRRRFKTAIFRTVLALIPVLAWQGYIAHVKNSAEYTHPSYKYQRAGYQFYNVGYLENLAYVDSFVPELGKASYRDLAERIARNLVRMPASLGGAVSVDAPRVRAKLERINKDREGLQVPIWLGDIPFAALGILVIFGMVLLAIRGQRLMVLYVLGSIGLMCLTSWHGQFYRYMWPLSPVLAIALFLVLCEIGDWTGPRRRWRNVGAAFIITLVAGVLSSEVFALQRTYHLSVVAPYKSETGQRKEYRLFFYPSEWQLQDQALDRLEEEAKPGEVVATSTPHWVYIRTGLRAVMPPLEPDVSTAQRLMDSVPVSYLVIDQMPLDITRRYALPMAESDPNRWKLIHSSDGGLRIYRRVNP